MSESAGDQLSPVADVVGVFGIRGELKIRSGEPEALVPGLTVVLRGNGRSLTTRVVSTRPQKQLRLVKLDGIDDPDAASAWRGATMLTAGAPARTLPALTYRDADLVGMHVVDESLGMLGDVRAVRHYPHCDMLIVGDGGLPVPLLQAFAVQVDIAAGEIRTALPAGFEELSQP